MKITQIKQTVKEVDVKILKMSLKVSDRFAADLTDLEGMPLFSQDDGYVPGFMPGNHYGDYVFLEINIETGQVVNWIPPTKEELETWVNGEEYI